MKRRLLLAAAASGLAATAQAGPPEPIARALVDQRAGRIPHALARDIRNGWGVCGRPGLDAPVEAYAAMLNQIGTRDLRIAFVQAGRDSAGRVEMLRRAMQAQRLSQPVPRITALVTAYMNDLGTSWAMQQKALLAFAPSGMLRAIEGPNEIDNLLAGLGTHGPDDLRLKIGPQAVPANHLAWCQAIGRFKRENPVLRHVTTVAPSLAVGPPGNFRRLSDVSADVDAGNLHFYAGHGRQPNYSMRFDPFVGTFQNMLHWARVSQVPHGPVWMTECGAASSGDYARSGQSQAKYLANQLFNYFAANGSAAGGQRMFIYQLFDGNGKPGDDEGNLGLFHHDATPKPAARLFAGLKHLLSVGQGYDDPANLADTAGFTPAYDPQAIVLPGFTEAGRADPSCLVLAKSDGRTLIVVWNEPVIDDGHGHETAPPEHPVSVGFGSMQTFAVHDLMDPDLDAGRGARRAAPGRGTGAEIVLRGHPVAIELL